ncbi:TonB-dependent siderophore receptor [Pseudomonas sp. TH49]|uniref:TonB-dependent siderophore receptor n=1 Tax=Pseudomonas sp. TH49 TaxID=2796413 RepID=UPI0019140AF4|nr:TonB-dependent siderophore receptor [Pseudomonas sp. TH49]MBK5343364.1 TonB-dependent siderophore receptor [Pseudomonas sp. TH49]
MTRPVVRLHPLAAALFPIFLAGAALPAVADDASVAQSRVQTFAVPAGDLSVALSTLAEQAGVAQAFDPALTRGKQTPGLNGRYTLEMALARLLSGSGLEAVQVGSTYRLQALPSGAGQVQLDSLSISAPEVVDGPFGPVDGYVAQNSISATKTGTPIHETPQSISVITRERMEAQGVQSVNEALRYTPGVSSYGANNRSDWYTVIRGFSPTTYLDSLQLPTTINLASWMVDPYMLERVEVLRGPAGVLYGQGDPGGVINQVSKRPSAVAANEVGVQYGTDARKQINFDSTGPLDDQGVWSYRMVGVLRDQDIKDTPWQDKRQALAPSITFAPDDDTRFTLLASYLYDDSNSGDGFYPSAGTIDYNPNGHIKRNIFEADKDFQKYEKRQYSFGYEFSKRLSDTWQVRQNLRYSHLDLNDNMIYGGGFQEGSLTTIDRWAGIADFTYKRWTVDNQAQADFSVGGIDHTVLLGLDYQHQDATDKEVYALAAPVNAYNPVFVPFDRSVFNDPDKSYPSNIDSTLNQTGLYLQDQLKFDDHWRLTLSGRYDWATSETQDHLAHTTTNQKDEAFSGRAGLVYLADNGLAPYVSYSTAFTPNAGLDANGKPFDPTEAKQYEAGIKFAPKDTNASVTAAVFQITQTNVLTPGPVNPNYSVQTGEIRSRGFELEGTASMSRELDVIASYTYQDVKITKANDVSEGKTPTFIPIPRNMASLWGDYTFHDGWLKNFGLGAGVRYVGRNPGAADNSLNIPSYTVFDASAHYVTGPWKLALNVTNLTNDDYISGCYDATRCLYGNPRTAVASATYRW